jgi:hypothetical protein
MNMSVRNRKIVFLHRFGAQGEDIIERIPVKDSRVPSPSASPSLPSSPLISLDRPMSKKELSKGLPQPQLTKKWCYYVTIEFITGLCILSFFIMLPLIVNPSSKFDLPWFSLLIPLYIGALLKCLSYLCCIKKQTHKSVVLVSKFSPCDKRFVTCLLFMAEVILITSDWEFGNLEWWMELLPLFLISIINFLEPYLWDLQLKDSSDRSILIKILVSLDRLSLIVLSFIMLLMLQFEISIPWWSLSLCFFEIPCLYMYLYGRKISRKYSLIDQVNLYIYFFWMLLGIALPLHLEYSPDQYWFIPCIPAYFAGILQCATGPLDLRMRFSSIALDIPMMVLADEITEKNPIVKEDDTSIPIIV